MKELKFKRFLPGSRLTGDPILKKLMVAGFLFLVAQALVVVLSLSRLPASVPLFYSRSWGASQLASKTSLWLLPFSTTLVLMGNLVLAHFFFAAEKLLSTALILAAAIFAFLILATEIKIVLLFY